MSTGIERLELEPKISPEDFLRRSGLTVGGDDVLRSEALDLFGTYSGSVRPKALWRESEVWVVDLEEVWLDEERFRSRCLAENLRGHDRVIAYVATCGTELDECGAGGDDLQRFWVDLLKELALEAVERRLQDVAARRLGSEGVASLNPGSADVDVWPLEQQRALFRLLGDTEATIGVVLTENLLMVPNKSLSGIFFPSEAGWVSCQMCRRRGCFARRASYRGPE